MRGRNFSNYLYSVLYKSGLLYVIRGISNLVFKNPIRILLTHRIIDAQIPLFDYYKCQNLTVGEFSKRIEFILRNYNFISLEEAIGYKRSKKIPANCIVLTFDDGYRDNFTNAFPILKQYRIPATIFLTADYIGTQKVLWHDAITYAIARTQQKRLTLSELGAFDLSSRVKKIESLLAIKYRIKFFPHQQKENLLQRIYEVLGFNLACLKDLNLMLSWEEVREMQDSGLISFQSHSASHAILTKIPAGQAEQEILKSRAIIEEKTKRAVNTLSYPNGWYNEELKAIVKKLGFIAACSCRRDMSGKEIKRSRTFRHLRDTCMFALARDDLDPEPFDRWASWMFGLFELASLCGIRSRYKR